MADQPFSKQVYDIEGYEAEFEVHASHSLSSFIFSRIRWLWRKTLWQQSFSDSENTVCNLEFTRAVEGLLLTIYSLQFIFCNLESTVSSFEFKFTVASSESSSENE